MTEAPARLGQFIADFTRLVDEAAHDEPRLLARGRELLAALVARDDWLPAQYARPHPQYYQQYLLHADPADRFSVVSFVWGPGQKTPIHDHTVWALIGMLRGGEVAQGFARGAAGEPMRPLETASLRPGDVDVLSPATGDIHRVANAHDDRVSVSVHVYGGNIGRIARHVYDEATGAPRPFVSGYANQEELDAAAVGRRS